MDFEITVQKELVIERIKTNLEEHKKIFQAAIEEYRRQVIDDLNAKIDSVKAGKPIQHFIALPLPEEHTEDYLRVLRMLEHHQDALIKLSEADYATYMDNEWSWQRSFIANTTSYATAGASRKR